MTHFSPGRLALVAGAVSVVWGVALPWLGRCLVVARHVTAMESLEVNPAAMFYTELERLPLRPEWIDDHVVLWP